MKAIMIHTGSKGVPGTQQYWPRSLRKRVFLTQLPLSLIMVVVVFIAVAFYPQSFHQPLFLAALALHVLLLLAAFSVPWGSLPRGTFLIIPYLDILAIGLFRGVNQQFLTAIGLLIFFPVFWLASAGLARRTAVVVSVAAALLIVWLPVLTSPNGFTPALLVKPLLFPLVVLAFAITVVEVRL